MGNVCNLRFVFCFYLCTILFFSSAQRISTSVSAQNVIPPSASFQAGLVCILFTQHDAINLKKKKKSLVNVNIGVVLCSHCRQKNRLYKELWRCLWLIQGRQLRQHLGEYVFLRMPKLFTPLEATHVCAGVNGGVFFSLTFSLKVLLLRKSLRATMKGKANGEN